MMRKLSMAFMAVRRRHGNAVGGGKWTLTGFSPKVPAMSQTRRSGPFIALAAAYVIALQALLLPLSVAVGGSPLFSLCSSGASVASSQSPAGHQTGCPCAAGCGMQCCVHAFAGTPQTRIPLGVTQVGALLPPLALEPVVRPAPRGPQLARAPPAA